jgi:hypothetical protein
MPAWKSMQLLRRLAGRGKFRGAKPGDGYGRWREFECGCAAKKRPSSAFGTFSPRSGEKVIALDAMRMNESIHAMLPRD